MFHIITNWTVLDNIKSDFGVHDLDLILPGRLDTSREGNGGSGIARLEIKDLAAF